MADLDEREKLKDATIRRISSGGGGQDFRASTQEGEGGGGGVIEERGGEEGPTVIEDSCSEGDGADGDGDDAAGKGKKNYYSKKISSSLAIKFC